ncbi:hypothetical protein ACFU99_02225 [Streptomyces sp. NPDC057654]
MLDQDRSKDIFDLDVREIVESNDGAPITMTQTEAVTCPQTCAWTCA